MGRVVTDSGKILASLCMYMCRHLYMHIHKQCDAEGEIEQEFVVDVHDEIAHEFDLTKYI